MSEPDFVGAPTEVPVTPPSAPSTLVVIQDGLLRTACVPCLVSELVPITGLSAGQIGEALKHFDRQHALCDRGRA